MTISAIFFSLACVAEVILPRLYNNVSEAASRSLFWTTNELNELPEVRFEFPFSLNSMAVLSSREHEPGSKIRARVNNNTVGNMHQSAIEMQVKSKS